VGNGARRTPASAVPPPARDASCSWPRAFAALAPKRRADDWTLSRWPTTLNGLTLIVDMLLRDLGGVCFADALHGRARGPCSKVASETQIDHPKKQAPRASRKDSAAEFVLRAPASRMRCHCLPRRPSINLHHLPRFHPVRGLTMEGTKHVWNQ
jgi:hypothetical protein